MTMELRTARTQFGPRQFAVEKETGPQRFYNYIKETLTRPISIGTPGLYFTPVKTAKGGRILKTEEPIGAAADIGFGAMTEERALSQARKALSGYGRNLTKIGVPKVAAAAQEGVAAIDMMALFRSLPKRVWDKIDDLLPAKVIPGHPEATGLYRIGKGGARKIWLSTRSRAPVKDLGHELAHHVDDLFEGTSSGSFARLRGVWGEVTDDMNSMQAFWENRDVTEMNKLYRSSPNEVFARRFADAIVDEGLDFREAVKIAAHETRANLSRARDVLHESIDAANKYLKGRGETHEIEKPWYWLNKK